MKRRPRIIKKNIPNPKTGTFGIVAVAVVVISVLCIWLFPLEDDQSNVTIIPPNSQERKTVGGLVPLEVKRIKWSDDINVTDLLCRKSATPVVLIDSPARLW